MQILRPIPRYIPISLLLILLIDSFPAASFSQSNPEDLYNQAVRDYTQNQFISAQEKFKAVSGTHAQDAQQYLAKIKGYQAAMSGATSILDRSADERDANSLEYVVKELQEAMKIKADGPGHPAQLLEKAQQQRTQILQKNAASVAARDRDFCAQALDAEQSHHYKQAALFICPVANDNPAYSCGGDEAVHKCEQMNDLAKDEKIPAPAVEDHPALVANSSLDKAKAAFDRNDFARALTLFRQISGDAKAAADAYIDKISRYQDAMTLGAKSLQDSKYEDAGAAFRSAANIKADGPGAPQAQALLMELMLGLDQFYSGNYASATQHLETYAHESSDRKPLVHFYLGASKLSRFFVTGEGDANLRQDALADLKVAKQAGFKASGQDVSPKILQAYKDLAN
jgi:hypothetical protein